jgi:hypothetical protein
MNDMIPKDKRRVEAILKRHGYKPADEKLWALVDEVWSDAYEQSCVDGGSVKFEDAKARLKNIIDELIHDEPHGCSCGENKFGTKWPPGHSKRACEQHCIHIFKTETGHCEKCGYPLPDGYR